MSEVEEKDYWADYNEMMSLVGQLEEKVDEAKQSQQEISKGILEVEADIDELWRMVQMVDAMLGTNNAAKRSEISDSPYNQYKHAPDNPEDLIGD